MQTLITHYGYAAVLVLMLAESACIPVPSEVVMLLGGALAAGALPGVHLSFATVAAAGIAGNVAGSYAAWAVGRYGGTAAWDRWGHYVGLRPHHLAVAQRWFDRRGNLAVFAGRLLPVVRTFISLPAGVAHMPPLRFGLYTLAGCAPWSIALAWIGYAVGDNWQHIAVGFHDASLAVVVILAVGALAALVHVVRRARRRTEVADVKDSEKHA